MSAAEPLTPSGREERLDLDATVRRMVRWAATRAVGAPPMPLGEIIDFATSQLVAALAARHPISSEDDNAGGADTARAGEYEPQWFCHEMGGFTEFVLSDAPTVVRDIGHGASLLLDINTRNAIGIRWAWPAAPTPTQEGKEGRSSSASLPAHPAFAAATEAQSPAGFDVHVLKTHPGPFAAVRSRAKKLEIRKADRDYKVGDTLWLDEYDPDTDTKSGEVEVRIVTHVLPGGQYGIEPGYVAMSIDDPAPEDTALSGRQGSNANTSEDGLVRDEPSSPTQEGADDNAGAGDTGGRG